MECMWRNRNEVQADPGGTGAQGSASGFWGPRAGMNRCRRRMRPLAWKVLLPVLILHFSRCAFAVAFSMSH